MANIEMSFEGMFLLSMVIMAVSGTVGIYMGKHWNYFTSEE